MPANLTMFVHSGEVKDKTTEAELKQISKLYSDWADDIGDMASFYHHKETASSALSEQYYKQLQSQLVATSKEVSNEVYGIAKGGMYVISDAVVKDAVDWTASLGFNKGDMSIAYSYVPDSVVRSIVTGQVYDSGWSLSKSIWGDNEKTLRDIYGIIAEGRAKQQGVYETAKMLEQYVNPNKALPWVGPTVIGPDGKPTTLRIYKKAVDYNAQRLVRTLNQHAYQQSFVETTKDNPFILKYLWQANGSRACQLCLDRDGTEYEKDKLPLDHPNGMCVMVPVTMDKDEMIQKLADWVNGEDGDFSDIDKFAKGVGYEGKPMTIQQFYDKYGTDRKSFASWYNNVGQEGREAFDKLYSLYGEGDTKNQFFKKYVTSAYGGGGQQASVAPKAERVTKEWLEQNLKIKGGARQFSQDELKAMARAIADDDVPDSYKKLMVDTMKKRGIKFDADRGAFYKPVDKAVHVNRRSKGLGAKESNEYGTYRHLPGSSRFQVRAKAELGSVGKDGSRFGTIFHEYGHAIDDLAPSRSTFSSQVARGFEKAMKEDMKAFEKRVADLRKAATSDYDSFRELFKIQQDLYSGAGHGFSDAVSAMHACPTGYDATKTLRTYYKHSEDYYRRGAGSSYLYDTQRKLNNAQTKACHKEGASELFANISASMTSSTERSIMQEYFPRSFEKFKEIIADVATKKKLM